MPEIPAVVINEENFPDEAFRNWIEDHADSDGDGELSQEEIEAVTEMDVSGLGIEDLEGVEVFKKLKKLNCSNNRISEMHVEQLSLDTLNYSGNALVITVYTANEVITRTMGDANGDGHMDMQDALRILRYANGQNVSVNEANADVNADGKVDFLDAMLILQYDSGWDVTLK